MNSSLCFDPGSLDQQVARGKTSPINKKRGFKPQLCEKRSFRVESTPTVSVTGTSMCWESQSEVSNGDQKINQHFSIDLNIKRNKEDE